MLEDTLVVPNFRISDMVTRHASGPQDESDDEDDEDTLESVADESEIIAAARRRWEQPTSASTSAPILPPEPSSSKILAVDPAEARRLAQNAKKKNLHRKSRKAKREAMREKPGVAKAPKAIVLARVRATSPIAVDFRIQSPSVPVASSGWMGLRDPEPQPLAFEPESREYSLEEAKAIPGMTVMDWQGCVSL